MTTINQKMNDSAPTIVQQNLWLYQPSFKTKSDNICLIGANDNNDITDIMNNIKEKNYLLVIW